MAQYLLMVSSQVGTMFLMMAVGFALAKLGKLTQASIPQLTNLLLTVVLPCMLVDSLQIERTPALLGAMGYTSLLVAVLYVLSTACCPSPCSAGSPPPPPRRSASAPCTATWALWACP